MAIIQIRKMLIVVRDCSLYVGGGYFLKGTLIVGNSPMGVTLYLCFRQKKWWRALFDRPGFKNIPFQ